MRWFFSNDAPIYTQLIEQIQVGIVTGVFPKGERLPSVRDLAGGNDCPAAAGDGRGE